MEKYIAMHSYISKKAYQSHIHTYKYVYVICKGAYCISHMDADQAGTLRCLKFDKFEGQANVKPRALGQGDTHRVIRRYSNSHADIYTYIHCVFVYVYVYRSN